MPRAFTLMTAMPPTTGHLQLIQFAKSIAGEEDLAVLITTQPDEPLVAERVHAIRAACDRLTATTAGRGQIHGFPIHRPLPQDPASPGFRDLWMGIMIGAGARAGDYLVTSELYGKWLAEMTGMVFVPYDIDRDINQAKATPCRNKPRYHWDDILPEFRPYLQARVTVFGAESTGKTTVARELANRVGHYVFEYARPYLLNTDTEITVESMTAIWHGQAALQRQTLIDYPIVIQDTDLYSTVGYWDHFAGATHAGGSPYSIKKMRPAGVREEADMLRSDLYIVTPSNIPFEPDPLRYGGDHRELEDEFWLDMLRRWEIPHVVLTESSQKGRSIEAYEIVTDLMKKVGSRIRYDRKGF